MKEMENNNFIHTLDAVYNLCSEIKELVNVETEKQEDEGSEGIILLSDNLQRLQSEITEMKTELSYDKERRERLRTAINLRLKELKEVYSVLSTTNGKIFAEQERISNELQRLQNLKVQNNHTHIIDFKTSCPFLWQAILLVSNAYQFKRNMVLSDNDLKYRFIRMHGRASGADLDTLEVIFTHNKDKKLIGNIRNVVEDFEYRTRVRAEKLERARLLQQEAEERARLLQQEAEALR